MPTRIYSLAKQLRIDCKQLLDICTKAGIAGKGSALASVTDKEVAHLETYLSTRAKQHHSPRRASQLAALDLSGYALLPLPSLKTPYVRTESQPVEPEKRHCDIPYIDTRRPEHVGEIGEQEACSLLQKVLRGHVSRLQGRADQGLDLAFTGRIPCRERPLLHFVAQVKTGHSYVTELDKHRAVKMKRGNAKRLLEWRSLEAPVLFLWVDDRDNEVYWSIVAKTARAKSVFLSYNSTLSPLTPFDLVVRLNRKRAPINAHIKVRPLYPPAKGSLKQVALSYYREQLLRTSVQNPTLGDVFFTWRGWRHMVGRHHSIAKSMQSLQLLPAAPRVLADPTEICGFRRLSNTPRGRLTTESRLIAFRRPAVEILGRGAADIVVVVRERIVYPTQWKEQFDFDSRMLRDLKFESIYERTGDRHQE